MPTFSRSCLYSPTTTKKLSTFLSPFSSQISSICKSLSVKMESQPISKRPTCSNCSKPLVLCLCVRLKNPSLDNKVHVTILQHSLEKNHPLNSARIAKLGLRNVDVFSVSDVKFEAQFVIRPLEEDYELCVSGGECTPDVCENASESLDVRGSRKRVFNQIIEIDSGVGYTQKFDLEPFSECPDIIEVVGFKGDSGALAKKDGNLIQHDCCNDLISQDTKKYNNEPIINIIVGKYGEIASISHPWNLQDEGKTPKFEHIITTPEAIKCLARGYVVKKLQKRQQGESIELDQFEEFEIKVPPGSALLFPAQKSVQIEAVDFEVKNLIVLDGTWAKANRMYNENPWLRALPCLKLDMDKTSLFSEVRHQPKPGYLSTIESIVYALEALGERDNLEGLHNLLNVFETMVEDQRRCKDDRLKKLSSSG